jgi:hypothetical protein
MKRNPFQDTITLFHTACGGEDGFASFKLATGEDMQWRLRPFSLTQVAGVDLVMRGSRRTVDLTPGRDIAILPFLRCFGAKIPDTQALRAALHILRHPRIQRQAARFYSLPFRASMEEGAHAIAHRLKACRQAPRQPGLPPPALRTRVASLCRRLLVLLKDKSAPTR